MSEAYDFEKIEKKWQRRWAEEDRYRVEVREDRPKFYMLEMLPYPSGALHLGHVRNYSLGDSIARFKSLQGFQVLHPIGWDAFGLPAENAAIKNKIPPEKWTLDNIEEMKKQCLRMGFGYDWNREITTCLPDYYRWNQWFFLKMFEKGLAYKKTGQVNWCEECQTVLANEQVVDGGCWRDGSPVQVKELDQWYLRISDYSEELLKALDDLEEWPDKVRRMQRNWIGKSEGTRVTFRLEEGSALEVFTTRVDTIYGATFLVLAPDHERVKEWYDDPEFGSPLREFADRMRKLGAQARTEETAEKQGVFTGRYAINPYSGERVPIWVANFVLKEYGTGAIMAVPAHDQRDFEFARKYEIDIRQVIHPVGSEESLVDGEAFTSYGILRDSGPFSGLRSEEAIDKMSRFAEEHGFGEKTVTYRLKDWGISRQRYWGTPIPIIHCEECGAVPVPEEDLPVVLPEVEEIRLGEAPLATVEDFVQASCPQCGEPGRRETDTMDTFVDSSWYFYRYTDPRNDRKPYDESLVRYWFPVDCYIGGVEHAVLHLIYMRFFSKVMRDLGLIDFDEPVQRLFTQGMVLKDGFKMSKSKGNVVSPDDIVRDYGADSLRLFIQFCAPPEGELEWNEQGLEGCSRFIKRYWRLAQQAGASCTCEDEVDVSDLSDSSRKLLQKLHQTIRKVTEDIERVHQNTAVAAIMELLNSTYEYIDRGEGDPVLLHRVAGRMSILLSPFAPHVAEEGWRVLGHETSFEETGWPEFDPELAREEEVEIVVQINGKIRSRFSASLDLEEQEMERQAMADERIQELLTGQTVRKVITVPGKLVNIVATG